MFVRMREFTYAFQIHSYCVLAIATVSFDINRHLMWTEL